MPIAIVAGYFCGVLLAFAARRALLRTYDPLRTRYGAVVAMFACGAIGPAALMLYVLSPDWFLLYLANPAHLPWPMMFPLVYGLVSGSTVVGFVVTHRAILGERSRALQASLALPPLFLLFFLVLGRLRFASVAYYDVFHAGIDGITFARSALMWPVIAASAGLVALLVFSILWVRRHVQLVENVPEPAVAEVEADSKLAIDEPAR